MMMDPLFLNPKINEEYLQNGFVKIPFVEEQHLVALQKLFTKYCPDFTHSDGQVFYSMFANSLQKNRQLKQEMNALLYPCYQKILTNYEVFAEMFLAKKKDNNPLLLHQDWSYAKEQETLTATLWLPLQSTSENNGGLFFIPGSHLFLKNYRSNSLPTGRIPIDETLQKHIVSVPVNAGEAVFFHQAIFHGSHANHSNQDRVVAASIILPKNKVPQYFHSAPNIPMVNCYNLTDDHFFKGIQTFDNSHAFDEEKIIYSFPYAHQIISSETLLAAIIQQKKNAF